MLVILEIFVILVDRNKSIFFLCPASVPSAYVLLLIVPTRNPLESSENKWKGQRSIVFLHLNLQRQEATNHQGCSPAYYKDHETAYSENGLIIRVFGRGLHVHNEKLLFKSSCRRMQKGQLMDKPHSRRTTKKHVALALLDKYLYVLRWTIWY